MDALNRALVRFLYSKFPDFNATDLSFFAKELFKEDIKKDREKLKEYGKIDIRPFLKQYDESFRKESGGTAIDPSTVEALIVTKKEGVVELDLDEDGTELNMNFTRTTRRNDFDEKISRENAKIQKVLRQQRTL